MNDYDVIVVGARLAGAATALLLARQGVRVLAVDRNHFPSDTLSSHQLQVPGVDCLARWGLLDRLVATGLPATHKLRFDAGTAVLEGQVATHGEADAMYSPRRTVLDDLLVEAAREAGAEVLEGFDVDAVLGDGQTVTGIRGRERDRGGRAAPQTFSAPLVVGADGKNSRLASLVQAAGAVRPAALGGALHLLAGTSYIGR